MLVHITLLTYLYTRLDPLTQGITAIFAISSGLAGFSIFLYLVNLFTVWNSEEFENRWKDRTYRTVKYLLIIAVIFGIMKLVIPTKEDALLIAGVTVGASVAEKTVDTLSKSELVGKVFSIVEAKVDNVLMEMKQQNEKLTDKKKGEK